jgi:D-serine dehydratase
MFGAVALYKKSGMATKGIHLVWATGGSMVPEEELLKYYREGKEKEQLF